MTSHGFSGAHVVALLRAHVLAADPEAEQVGLADFLYARWYAAPQTRVVLDASWPPLEGMLRVAQGEALGWRPAVVVRRGAGGVVVARDEAGRARALLRGSYAHRGDSGRAGLPPVVGDHISMVPRSGGVVSQGWWRTWGGGWDPRLAPAGAFRIYLGPAAQGLPGLVGALTTTMEAREDPWMLKAAMVEDHLGRADALVVYLLSMAAFNDVVGCARNHVRDEPGPPLTEVLGPGMSWAEDPGDGRSFGESRCALVAQACERAKGRDGDAFLWELRKAFLEAGLDPAAPHLRGDGHG